MAFLISNATLCGMDGEMPRWKPIIERLRRFEQDFCSPTMPPLRIVHASDRTWSDAEYRARKPKGFPSNKRGVYLLFDSDERLLYVGVATGCFDQRVWDHDSWSQRRYIDIIIFDDRWLILAPALEFYLIVALNPPDNTVHGKRRLPADIHDPIPRPPNEAKG